jgi:hypothetical protein
MFENPMREIAATTREIAEELRVSYGRAVQLINQCRIEPSYTIGRSNFYPLDTAARIRNRPQKRPGRPVTFTTGHAASLILRHEVASGRTTAVNSLEIEDQLKVALLRLGSSPSGEKLGRGDAWEPSYLPELIRQAAATIGIIGVPQFQGDDIAVVTAAGPLATPSEEDNGG